MYQYVLVRTGSYRYYTVRVREEGAIGYWSVAAGAGECGRVREKLGIGLGKTHVFTSIY